MSKILRVIDPFFVMQIGDTFTLADDNYYVSEHNEEFRKATDTDEVSSSYNSTFNISQEYAKDLIREGFLEEVEEQPAKDKETRPFVNVFDEISALIDTYQKDLDNIENTMKEAPQCMKVEKETVLTNVLNVLNHLKMLKK